jgi:hypothetical protein
MVLKIGLIVMVVVEKYFLNVVIKVSKAPANNRHIDKLTTIRL